MNPPRRRLTSESIGARALRVYTSYKRVRNFLFTVMVKGGFGAFGRESTIVPPAGIEGASHIWVGAGVYIGPGNAFPIHDKTAGAVRIQLHDRVSIAGWCTISAARSVILEEGVLLARNVYIADHNHAFGFADDVAIRDTGIATIEPVVIGAGAWLGQNVVITPGVTVGRGAVVAANSVVRTDVPDRTLVAGSPARIIRSWDPGDSPNI